MAINWNGQYKVNGVDPTLYVEHKGKHSQIATGEVMGAETSYTVNGEDIGSYLYIATMPWEAKWTTEYHYVNRYNGAAKCLDFIKDGYLLRNLSVFHVTGDGTATYMDGPGKIIGSDYNESGGATGNVTITLQRLSDTSLRLGNNYYSPSNFGDDFDKIPYVIGIIICGGGGGGCHGYSRSQGGSTGGGGGGGGAVIAAILDIEKYSYQITLGHYGAAGDTATAGGNSSITSSEPSGLFSNTVIAYGGSGGGGSNGRSYGGNGGSYSVSSGNGIYILDYKAGGKGGNGSSSSSKGAAGGIRDALSANVHEFSASRFAQFTTNGTTGGSSSGSYGGGGGGASLMNGGTAKINSSTNANGSCGSGGGGGRGAYGATNGGNGGRGQVFIFY